MPIAVAPAQSGFDRWEELHALLVTSFAYMADRIDPPSSLLRMTARVLAEKAQSEMLVLATDSDRIVGCLFLRRQPEALYAGKLAVDGAFRGMGIARRLFAFAEEEARRAGLPFLELQTRIELTENHETFAHFGFEKTSETAHAGYDRPTSITMRKRVS